MTTRRRRMREVVAAAIGKRLIGMATFFGTLVLVGLAARAAL